MVQENDADIEALLREARGGSQQAREALLARYRDRLSKMVTLRLDKRLAARVDASDVVQEALRVANSRLPEYLMEPCAPFYPWLRAIAIDRLIEMHRRHVKATKRSVVREQSRQCPINEESENVLAESLAASSLNASRRMLLAEMMARVRCGMGKLAANDREILELRHLEQLSVEEIASVLGINKSTVTTRSLRALQRLRALMGEE
jgi:RNA polymerase sigma-70 factor (ECF subfamily)